VPAQLRFCHPMRSIASLNFPLAGAWAQHGSDDSRSKDRDKSSLSVRAANAKVSQILVASFTQ
jgi:hypothetical protein